MTFAAGQDGIWVLVYPTLSGAEASESAVLSVAAGSGYAVAAPDKATEDIYGDAPPGADIHPNPLGDYSHSPLLDVFYGRSWSRASCPG